jgi:WD40 repeat protein
VVLNACATQAHVDALRDAGVGAVIATSRTVEDAIAHQFAVLLYQGLSSGAGIKRAYDEATAGVRFKHGAVARGSTAESMHASAVTASEQTVATPTWPPAPASDGAERSTRDIKRKQTAGALTTDDGRWPWDLYFRAGAEETVAPWALPEAAGNPLFGLPKVQEGSAPLTEPFRHLRPFTREHAELFFGRGKDIRALYDKVTSTASEPVVLLFGATGVGKSSLLDAGVLPRLTSTHEVRYATRDRSLGLLGTLARELGVEAVGGSEATAIADGWRALEARSGRPLFVVIDQVEEAYTGEDSGRSPPGAGSRELEAFASAIGGLFTNPSDRPRGRLVLGFRKEWLSEVKAALEAHRVARTEHRLEQLTRGGVLEAITGPTRLPARRMPTRLELEPGLDVLIADDLLAKRASHVAPLLQILLATMWAEAPRRGDVVRFDATLYESVQAKAKQLDKFLDEQLAALRSWHPGAVDSGLVLDFLRFYTTPKGTSDEHTLEEETKRYPNASEPSPGLRTMCARLFLVVERVDESGTPVPGKPARLAHDTLAAIVRERFDRSDLPGPRAKRVLDGRSAEWKDGKTGVPLDAQDLAVVEAGQSGMRVWNDEEMALIEASRKAREQARRRRAWVIRGAIAAVALIAAFGVGSWVLYRQSQGRLAESQSRELGVRSLGTATDRRDVALMSAAAAYARSPTFEARRALFSHLAAAPRLIRVVPTTAAEMMFTADGRSIVLREDAALGQGASRVEGPVAGRLHFLDVDRGIITRSVELGVDSVYTGVVRLDRGGMTYSADLTSRADTKPHAIAVWSLETGSRLGTVPQDPVGDEVTDWMVSPRTPGGATYIATTSDSSVTVWDLATGQPAHTLRGHTASPRVAAFSPDGTLLVTSADDGRVIVWGVETGQLVRTVTVPPDRAPSLAITRDNSTLVLQHDDTVALWPLGARAPVQPERFSAPDLRDLVIAPGDSLIAVEGRNGVIHILPAPFSFAAETLAALGAHNAMEFSPTGARLALLDVSGLLHLWDLGANGFVQRAQVASDASIEAASSDARFIVSASLDTFTVWDVATRAPRNRIIVGRDTTQDTTTLMLGGRRRRIVRNRNRPLASVEGVGGGTILASPADGKGMFPRVVYDTTGAARKLPDNLASAPALDPTGARLAYGLRGTRAAVVTDLRTNAVDTLSPDARHPPDDRGAPDVEFSQDGSLLFVQLGGGVILVWDVASRRLRDSVTTNGEFAFRKLTNADGTVIAAVMLETVAFWRSGTGEVGRLRIELSPASPVALSPDGLLFAHTWQDAVVLSDVTRRESLGTVAVGRDVVGLAFIDGGARLRVVHKDGFVDHIETAPTLWLDRVCAIAGSDGARIRWRQDNGGLTPLPPQCEAVNVRRSATP